MRCATSTILISIVTATAIAISSLTLSPLTARADSAPVTEKTLTVPAVSDGAKVTVNGASLTVRYALRQSSGLTFSMVALTWSQESGPAAVLQFRTRTGSAWTPWLDAESSDDLGGSLKGSDPYFASDSTGVEVRALGAATTTLADLKVRLINPRAVPGDAAVARASAAGAQVPNGGVQPRSASNGQSFVPRPAIISRAAWGANESLLRTNGSDCVPPNYDRTVQAGIVHHTAGSNNYQAADSARIVRGIYYYHVVTRGWCDIGYNMLIDKYGQVFEGRHGGVEFPVHGAHAGYWNTNTVGVSVMMNSSTMQPTASSMNALVNVLAWKLSGNYRDPAGTVTLAGKRINRISQHGDVMSTDCAGSGIAAQLPSIRTRVRSMITSYGPSPIQRLWQANGADIGPLGSPYIMERSYNGGRITTFAKGSAWMNTAGQAFWAQSALAGRYSALGWSTLGWPTASQRTLPFGSMSYLSVAKGGALVTSDASTAWVKEPIWSYLMGHQTQFARLGSPLREETLVNGVRTQAFQNGTASVVNGAVRLSLKDPEPYSVFPEGFGDRTGDGRADLVGVTAAGYLVTISTTSSVTAARPVVRASGFLDVNWLAQVPDLTGDGTTEVLIRRTNGTLWLLPGRSTGGFGTPVLVGIGWSSMRNLSIMGDMTGDGRANLLAIDAKHQLFRYSFMSATKLTAKTLVGISWGDFRLTAGFSDFTGDRTPDLLAVNSAGELWDYSWQPHRGGWVWRKVGIGWTGIRSLAVPGDVNADGRVDLMATWSGSGYVQPYLNAGAGRWSRWPVWGTMQGYRALG